MPESNPTCWSCGASRAPTDAICPACGKVQPPPPAKGVVDKFGVLGFPRAYDLEAIGATGAGDPRVVPFVLLVATALQLLGTPFETILSRRWETAADRFSLEQTTILNDAYRTLRDPVKRAEHLLELRGVKVAGEERGAGAKMPEEFLEQAMEDREKLLEAKMEGGPEAVERLANGVRGKRQEAMDEIARILRAPGAAEADLQRTAQLLARLRYYARYLDEVEGRAAEM